MKIGVIADDFTGATDAASFMVKNGLAVIQVSDVTSITNLPDADAIVVSLKTRSCEVSFAISQTLDACDWLLNQGCQQIYFKYCSTFDSTADGNIGPVAQALMTHLSVKHAIVCPALPVNGRTVYQGNLFVYQQLLNESGMRNHPITPMTDANLLRLMAQQTNAKVGLLDWQTLQQGDGHAFDALALLTSQGNAFIVCDALDEQDLERIARLCQTHRLVTGGSGLAGALAKVQGKQNVMNQGYVGIKNAHTKGVILSGSCSVMTNQQVVAYQNIAASFKVDVDRCIDDANYIDEIEEWIISHADTHYYPMVFATVDANELSDIQRRYGSQASECIEKLFHRLVKQLYAKGFQNFISAGGETSGTVTQALDISQFKVGIEIAPGVPWVSSLDGHLNLALKSGNFGDVNFFQQAQDILQ